MMITKPIRLGSSFIDGLAKWVFSFAIVLASCNKLVEIPQPINTITASKTFSSDANATSAVLGIYSNMSFDQGTLNFANGAVTIRTGLSSDELSSNAVTDPFFSNTLIASNTDPYTEPDTYFWQPAYYDIYMANAAITGLQASTTVTPATKNQLIGEAEFIRAYCYFYLTNLFGDVPLVLNTNSLQNSLLPRAPQATVYQQIIADLKDAQKRTISDYSLSNGEHIRANKWAATALLARVYLYQKQWQDAITQATAVINSGNYNLLTDLNGVFLKNNNETIMQLQTISTHAYYITFEGQNLIPLSPTSVRAQYLSSQLMSAFEPGDQRRVAWVDSSISRGKKYYCPYKYKLGLTQSNSANIAEYYTLLRLAEQYLIRAEAEANLGDLPNAISDLDIIRTRAGLPNLSPNLAQTDVLAAVAQERRIELFAEWGHRWLDLKRTGQAVSVLNQIPVKAGHMNNNQLLYPIPISEIQNDANLRQNPGY